MSDNMNFVFEAPLGEKVLELLEKTCALTAVPIREMNKLLEGSSLKDQFCYFYEWIKILLRVKEGSELCDVIPEEVCTV